MLQFIAEDIRIYNRSAASKRNSKLTIVGTILKVKTILTKDRETILITNHHFKRNNLSDNATNHNMLHFKCPSTYIIISMPPSVMLLLIVINSAP